MVTQITDICIHLTAKFILQKRYVVIANAIFLSFKTIIAIF